MWIKQEWKEQVRKTKIATHKKHLSKKELNEIMEGMLKLGLLLKKKKKENWVEKPKLKPIGQIIKEIYERT